MNRILPRRIFLTVTNADSRIWGMQRPPHRPPKRSGTDPITRLNERTKKQVMARIMRERYSNNAVLAGVAALMPKRGFVTEREVCDTFHAVPVKLIRHRLNTLVRGDYLGRYEGRFSLTPKGSELVRSTEAR